MKSKVTSTLFALLALLLASPHAVAQEAGKSSLFKTAPPVRQLGAAQPAATARPRIKRVSRSQKDVAAKSRAKGVMHKAAQSGITVTGCMVYSDDWYYGDDSKYGIYSYTVADGATFQPVFTDEKLNLNVGGAIYDNVLHGVNSETQDQMMCLTYREYEMNSWTETANSGRYLQDFNCIALCTAYDEASKLVYGCFYNSGGSGYELATINYQTFERKLICTLTDEYMAMAINQQGELYAITYTGKFCKVDKQTGAVNEIGPVGVDFYGYTHGAAFDQNTGKFYWAPLLRDDTSALFEVSLTTGAATKIATFPACEELSFFTVQSAAAEGAPAPATNFKAVFDKGATQGTLSFTMPTTTAGGKPLSGEIAYMLQMDGQDLAYGKAQAGDDVTEQVTASQGMHYFSLILENAEGESLKQQISQWAGADCPAAPTDVDLALNASTRKAVVSWTEPTATEHGGWADLSDLSYTLVRQPDNVQVAEGLKAPVFTEVVPDNTITTYTYDVYAVSGGVKSKPGTSNGVTIGSVYGVPYSETFTGSLGDFIVIDGNEDGTKWTYSTKKCAYINTSYSACDDWIVSPTIRLSADCLYDVSYEVWATNPAYPERYALYYGTGDNLTTYTELVAPVDITCGIGTVTTNKLRPAMDGDYRFAWRCLTPQASWEMRLDNINITLAAVVTAPEAVTGMKAEAAQKGEMKATVSFTAPAKTVGGETLATLDKVEVMRGQDVIHTFTGVAAVAQMQFVDERPAQGDNIYTVVPYANDRKGLAVSDTVFVGVDVPAMPANIRLSDNLDGTATLSWDAATNVGANGGYVDASRIKHNVYNLDDENMMQPVAMGVEGNTYSISGLPVSGDMQSVYYLVSAVNDAAESDADYSNVLVTGDSYELPFVETFSNGMLDNPFWLVSTNTSYAFRLITTESDSDIPGCASLLGSMGTVSTLSTGKINIGNANNPMLGFSYYSFPGENATLLVEVEKDGQTMTEMITIENSQLTGQGGWRKETVSLSRFKGAKYIRLHFSGICHNTEIPVVIDGIYVRDVFDQDLEAKLSVASSVKAGNNLEAAVRVSNVGGKDVPAGYTVSLYAGNDLVEAKQGQALGVGKQADYLFSVPTSVASSDQIDVHAVVTCDADNNPDNNETPVVAVAVLMPSYPTVSDLTARAGAGSVSLSWSAPDTKGAQITESFEDYEAFTISDLGQWTLTDADRSDTYPFSGLALPHGGEPMAYQVFNPEQAGIDIVARPYRAAHTGSQYLISYCATSKLNDDWLISPRLDGRAQTISMFASSWSDDYGLETFEILYSTTGTDVSDFKLVSRNEAPNQQWTEFTADLPEGTKYFAVRCTSADKSIFMLDDITYQAGDYEISGYNIYRDGRKIGSVGASQTSYNDTQVDMDTDYVYNVSVVYTVGESALSNDAATSSGITSAQTAGQKVGIQGGTIVVSGAQGQQVCVFAADGSLVMQGVAGDTMRVPARSGVYVVTVGGKAVKVAVK